MQVGEDRGARDGLLQRGAPGEHVAQAAAWTHAQSFVNARPPQVRIDEQDAHALLRQHDGAVDAGCALALLRKGAGHHDDLGRRAQIREQQRSAQGAVGFRHL